MRTLLASLAAAALVAGGIAAPADAQRSRDPSRDDQVRARQELKAGRELSLREIERRVLPTMRGAEYVGPSYDPTTSAYRLTFIREGKVTWVDVDARTGRVLKVSR